jgi:hypothetical protein
VVLCGVGRREEAAEAEELVGLFVSMYVWFKASRSTAQTPMLVHPLKTSLSDTGGDARIRS